MDEATTTVLQHERGQKATFDANLPLPYISRRRPEVKLTKSYEHMSKQHLRENWLDLHSIYSRRRNTSGLPLPGHRSNIAKDASNIEWKMEKSYIRKMEGPPESPHISGSARKGRHRNRIRQSTANSISQEYQWVHNGLHGKMTLNNRRYHHFLPDRYTNHFDDDDLHYCEVLGQKTCARCLANTNRLMAAEYQNETFPGIRVSATDLIAPRLSKTLTRRRATDAEQTRGATNGGGGGGGATTLGGFDTAISPPPYRQGSSLVRGRSNVVISTDKMERSLQMLLKRDARNQKS